MSQSIPRLAYSYTTRNLHWLTAIPFVGCIGTVMAAQQAPKEHKGNLMFQHKSLGLLTGMMVAPRIAHRVLCRSEYQVQELAGNSALENVIGKAAHYAMYGFMAIMPTTGIAMGYFGGKGLPFFFTTLPSIEASSEEAKKANGAIAKQSFSIHKQVGTYGKYLVPAHVGAALGHQLRGQAIFSRMNPFGKNLPGPKGQAASSTVPP